MAGGSGPFAEPNYGASQPSDIGFGVEDPHSEESKPTYSVRIDDGRARPPLWATESEETLCTRAKLSSTSQPR